MVTLPGAEPGPKSWPLIAIVSPSFAFVGLTLEMCGRMLKPPAETDPPGAPTTAGPPSVPSGAVKVMRPSDQLLETPAPPTVNDPAPQKPEPEIVRVWPG